MRLIKAGGFLNCQLKQCVRFGLPGSDPVIRTCPGPPSHSHTPHCPEWAGEAPFFFLLEEGLCFEPSSVHPKSSPTLVTEPASRLGQENGVWGWGRLTHSTPPN